MKKQFTKNTILFAALSSTLLMSFVTGCASGGYKLTREYSGWVNKQNVIVRVILYILTLPVYGVTLIVDAVIFNTLDFWDGRVSQGAYQFNKGGQNYFVQHAKDAETGLKRSRIEINKQSSHKQIIVLQETPTHEVELFVDGILRGKSSQLSNETLFSLYNSEGKKIETHKVANREQLVSSR